jgi:DNA-binding Xre family transcriptional regulator
MQDTMAVRWKVKGFLDANGITPYRLMKESGLAQGTVYRLVNDDTTGLNTETLNAVLKALSKLSKKTLTVNDVLEYTEDNHA